ncbi:hypothetical protein L1887_21017 [Cichorium endivia]|nr:hypothetical protein L1887_21017 [Cichorium endivia]
MISIRLRFNASIGFSDSHPISVTSSESGEDDHNRKWYFDYLEYFRFSFIEERQLTSIMLESPSITTKVAMIEAYLQANKMFADYSENFEWNKISFLLIPTTVNGRIPPLLLSKKKRFHHFLSSVDYHLPLLPTVQPWLPFRKKRILKHHQRTTSVSHPLHIDLNIPADANDVPIFPTTNEFDQIDNNSDVHESVDFDVLLQRLLLNTGSEGERARAIEFSQNSCVCSLQVGEKNDVRSICDSGVISLDKE